MQYSYTAKNVGRDLIYENRLKLIRKHNFNIHSSPKMYGFYMDALLGIILN